MSNPVNSFFSGLGTMKREFWGIQALTFVSSTAFYLMFNMLGIYLHSDLGLEWIEVGMLGGMFAVVLAVGSFLCGMIVDRIGFRNGMLIGTLVSMLGRAGLGVLPFLSLSQEKVHPYIVGALILAALGEAFLQPLVNAGTAHFSSKAMRTKAFNVQVVTTQLGGGFLVALILGTTWAVGEPLHHLYFISAAFSLPIPLVAFLFMKDESPAESSTVAPAKQEAKQKRSFKDLIPEIFREKSFWVIILLLLMLMGTRMAFNLQGTLYIPYYLSTLGKKVELGHLLLINPAIIAVGLIFLTKHLEKIRSYSRLTLGMGVIAASVLVLAIPPHLLQGNGDITQAYYTMAFIQLLVYSLGEMIVSPAFKEYILSLAPQGRMASYAGAFFLPTIPVKFVPAVISGFLLARYCPDGLAERIKAGPIPYLESPQMMFVIWGVILVTGPILLLMFRWWFAKQENPKQEHPKRKRTQAQKQKRKQK